MDEELWDILSEPFTDELGNRNIWQKSRNVKDEEYFKIKQLFQKYTAQAVREAELKARIDELMSQQKQWGYLPFTEEVSKIMSDLSLRIAALKQELNGGKG